MGAALGASGAPCDGLQKYRTSHAASRPSRSWSSDGRFVDGDFPPDGRSLGVPKNGRRFLTAEQRVKTRWVRLPAFLQANGVLAEKELSGAPRLEWDDIEPSDLAQGWLGNCWLIASIAALAEFPSAVRHLFVEADVLRGRYVIQLYDMGRAQWEQVEIDDYIPCTHEDDWSAVPCRVSDDGMQVYRHDDLYDEHKQKKVPGKWVPLFGRPKGSKVWALLLEKAMAKFVGSYAYLAGGSEPYALMAFTAFPIVYCFVRPAADPEETKAVRGKWGWTGAQYIGRQSTGQCYASIPDAPPNLGNMELWAKLLDYDKRNYIMTASITKYKPPESLHGYFQEDGLVLGHAYSLISSKVAATSTGNVQLVMLRNPHGESSTTAEGVFPSKWRGAWCDHSYCWDTHPEVASQVGYNPMQDGIFWMSWEDFCSTFDKICILAKSMEEPRAAQALARRRNKPSANLCLGLETMAAGSASTLIELRQLSLTFDPFTSLPEFLDDGTFETRLRWEATKPGRLQAYLDLNRSSGNTGGMDWISTKVKELGLSDALGPDGYLVTPRCETVAENGIAAASKQSDRVNARSRIGRDCVSPLSLLLRPE